MITPIATVAQLPMLKTKGNPFKSLLGKKENLECTMASVTHQYGISQDDYNELINHHC
jgi:hypothetical protein